MTDDQVNRIVLADKLVNEATQRIRSTHERGDARGLILAHMGHRSATERLLVALEEAA